MQPTAGAVRRRNVPSRRTLFPAASMGVRAAWPPVRLSCGAEERCGAALRGHARDDISPALRTGATPGSVSSLSDDLLDRLDRTLFPFLKSLYP